MPNSLHAMKFCRGRFVLLFIISICCSEISLAGSKNPDADIFSYRLHLVIDEMSHSIQGEAELKVRALRDSLTSLDIVFALPSEFIFAQDSGGAKLKAQISDSSQVASQGHVILQLPRAMRLGDSTVIRLEYKTTFDTNAASPAFINEREIFLPSNDSARWWPIVESGTDSSPVPDVQLQVVLSPDYSVISTGDVDTASISKDEKEWTFVHKSGDKLSDAFFVCASKNFETSTFRNKDSTVCIRFFSNPPQFNPYLASTVTSLLGEAAEYFSSIAFKPSQLSDLQFVMIGSGEQNAMSRHGKIIVGRNLPAFSVYDSLVNYYGTRNPWVCELARLFVIPNIDSIPWFNDGWTNYLADRFFLHRADGNESMKDQERIEILMRTLDFYPASPLSHEQEDGANERNAFSNRGAYVFSMLEYILGDQLFDSVVTEMSSPDSETSMNIGNFQKLCGNIYGSSLDWFFNEWINRTSFPEFVLSTEETETNRGTIILNAHVEQRGDIFTTPANLVITYNNRSEIKRIFIRKQVQTFEFLLPEAPLKVDLDPDYLLLRWVPKLRLLAHARTSIAYLMFDRDTANSAKEAQLTLELDPNNVTGWDNEALYALGKIAILQHDAKKSEEYFRKASTLDASEPAQLFSVLSLVRLGNVLEVEGRRDEALQLYELAVSFSQKNLSVYGYAFSEAEKYLHEKFISTDEFWYTTP
jgi:tetratricopeptide (TPR) repeat protein